MSSRLKPRGVSLIEVVVVLGVLAILGALAIPRLSFSQQTTFDAKSQTALSALVRVQETRILPTLNGFGDASVVMSKNPEMTVIPGTSPSTLSDQISLATSPTAFGGATWAANTCWVVHYDLQAPAGTNRTLYAFNATLSQGNCTGVYALSLAPSVEGASFTKPLAL